MFRPCTIALAALMLIAAADEASARNRNPAYYGTTPRQSARTFSGEYQAFQRKVVPTFTLPVYGGGFYRAPLRRGFYNRGFYPAYQQPVIIYPPAIYRGF